MVYEVIKRLVRYLSGVPSSMRRSVNVVETLSANESALKLEKAFLVTNVLFKLLLFAKTCAILFILRYFASGVHALSPSNVHGGNAS